MQTYASSIGSHPAEAVFPSSYIWKANDWDWKDEKRWNKAEAEFIRLGQVPIHMQLRVDSGIRYWNWKGNLTSLREIILCIMWFQSYVQRPGVFIQQISCPSLSSLIPAIGEFTVLVYGIDIDWIQANAALVFIQSIKNLKEIVSKKLSG